MAKKGFGGTTRYNILVKKVPSYLLEPLELFRAPKGVAAPRLGTNELEVRQIFNVNKRYENQSKFSVTVEV